tara:strand:+ start:4946 stop:5632 length:687 start_codon:yes stop_codon:yes gene_type:complete
MNTEYILQATIRENQGTSSSKKIRRDNGIPAVVYGGKDNSNIILDSNEVAKKIKDSGFYSNVIQLKIGKKTVDVILKDLQRDPSKSSITHMDFFAVDKNKAVIVNVPILFVNEDTCSGVKLGGGKLSHIQTELEVSCLPKDIPENIQIDVADLEIGHSIHMSEIKMPANVEHAVTVDEEHDSPVVSCYEPKAEKVEDVVEASASDSEETPAADDKKEESASDTKEESK